MKKLSGFLLCCWLSVVFWQPYLSFKELYKAVGYINANDPDRAISALLRAKKLYYGNIIAKYYLAGISSNLGHYDEALRQYSEVERLNPHFLLANYFKSLNYKRSGRYKEAYLEICKAERLYPISEVIQAEKRIYKIKRR